MDFRLLIAIKSNHAMKPCVKHMRTGLRHKKDCRSGDQASMSDEGVERVLFKGIGERILECSGTVMGTEENPRRGVAKEIGG